MSGSSIPALVTSVTNPLVRMLASKPSPMIGPQVLDPVLVIFPVRLEVGDVWVSREYLSCPHLLGLCVRPKLAHDGLQVLVLLPPSVKLLYCGSQEGVEHKGLGDLGLSFERRP